MSSILECDGVFQVPVPDGWTVTGESGRSYDLSHESEEVAVNISVYRRAAAHQRLQHTVETFRTEHRAPPRSSAVTSAKFGVCPR